MRETTSAVPLPKNNSLFAKPPTIIALAASTPSWHLTQLGVNNILAVINGGLAGKPLFFGTAIAETVSTALNAQHGCWDGGHAEPPTSGEPWSIYSGNANTGNTRAGIFSTENLTGATSYVLPGHRTILSGY